MAPEIRGENPTYGHPADVFGFGLVALSLVAGPDLFPLGKDVDGKQRITTRHEVYVLIRSSFQPMTLEIGEKRLSKKQMLQTKHFVR